MVIAIVDSNDELRGFYKFLFEEHLAHQVKTYESGTDFLARYDGGADVALIQEAAIDFRGKDLKQEIQMRWDPPVVRKGGFFVEATAPPGCLAEPLLSPETAMRKIEEVMAQSV